MFSFVHFVTKNIFSSNSSKTQSKPNMDSDLGFDPVIAHFVKTIHNETPSDNLDNL